MPSRDSADRRPTPSKMQRLVDEARQGSPEALGKLLEACRAYLLRVAHRHLDPELRGKVDSSDLVQETFLKAQRDFGRFAGQSEQELLAWLRRVLLNSLANVKRHYQGTAKRRLERSLTPASEVSGQGGEQPIDPGNSPSGQAIASELDKTLEQALGQLPQTYRQVIQWRNYESLSFEAIGQRLGRSAEAARKLWARAIDQLGQTLEPPP